MYNIKNNNEMIYERVIRQLRRRLENHLGDYSGGDSYLSKQPPQQNQYSMY